MSNLNCLFSLCYPTFVFSESKKLLSLWRALGQQLKLLLKTLWWTLPSKKTSLVTCPSIPMVNSESIRSFSSFSFKGLSGERQNLHRAAVAELSVVACIVPSVSMIQKALPGSSVSFSFHKETKITFPFLQYQFALASKILYLHHT